MDHTDVCALSASAADTDATCVLDVGGSQVLDLRMTVGHRTERSFVVNLTPGENNKALMLLTLRLPTAISPSEAGYAKDGRRMGSG